MKSQSPTNTSKASPESIYRTGMSLDDLARAYARACAVPEAEIDEFLATEPKLLPEFANKQEFRKAAVHIEAALDSAKPILIFGDADVDGMTASFQMHDYLRAQGQPAERIRLFIPDRQRFGYGLTARSLDHILAQFKPQLVIALDCGSAAVAEVRTLTTKGMEVIVVDHHPAEAQTSPTAHVNPKAVQELEHLGLLCTAGLVFFLCDALNSRRPSEAWDRKRSLILAGLGTVLDCVPLLRQNRALVKWALRLCNDGSLERSCPGLHRLQWAFREAKRRFDPRITVETLSYAWGPCLNAAGRIGPGQNGIGAWSRDQALLLLQERFPSSLAADYAKGCVAANEERRVLMEKDHGKVQLLAEQAMAKDPNPAILLVAEPTIRAGLAGPLAARLMESHLRPAIVCGLDESGIWRGSGRAPAGYDLGRVLSEGMKQGLLDSGGGHGRAAGLAMDRAKLSGFRNWLMANAGIGITAHSLVSSFEIVTLGPLNAFPAQDWLALFERLAPQGEGLKCPVVECCEAELVQLRQLSRERSPIERAPVEGERHPERRDRASLKRERDFVKRDRDSIDRQRDLDGPVWAMLGKFDVPPLEEGAFWPDVQRASDRWYEKGRFDLWLVPEDQRRIRDDKLACLIGWRVVESKKSPKRTVAAL